MSPRPCCTFRKVSLDEALALLKGAWVWQCGTKVTNPQQHVVRILGGSCSLLPRSGLWGVSVPLAQYFDLTSRAFCRRIWYWEPFISECFSTITSTAGRNQRWSCSDLRVAQLMPRCFWNSVSQLFCACIHCLTRLSPRSRLCQRQLQAGRRPLPRKGMLQPLRVLVFEPGRNWAAASSYRQ